MFDVLSRLGCLYEIRRSKSEVARFGYVEHITLQWPTNKPALQLERKAPRQKTP